MSITRKEFIEQVGLAAAALLVPSCLGSCRKSSNSQATQAIDFTINVASGALSKNGGYEVQNGVIVARTNSGTFLAVASTCTHAGTTVQFSPSSNTFLCPNHGARFDTMGNVMQGPAVAPLQKYNTTLTGDNLRVYS